MALRWVSLLAALLLFAPAARANDAVICAEYWKKELGSAKNFRFLTLEAVPASLREKWGRVLAFAVTSASRNANLDLQLPKPVPGAKATYVIDLDTLEWAAADFDAVTAKYPYASWANVPVMFVRGDWLVYELANTRDSDAYYRLLYGGAKIPKTEAEFWAFWKVNEKDQGTQNYGWIEIQSQVNKAGVRFIEHLTTATGNAAWRTKDAKKVLAATDPFAKLDGTHKHDGREYIVQFDKFSIKHSVRAQCQTYLLTDGAGKVVQEAPVDLVEDYKRTFAQAAIINNAGCVPCHDKGMNFPSVNGLKSLLAVGVELKAIKLAEQQAIELFHLMGEITELNRNNEDFQAYVKACNGLSGPDNAKQYAESLLAYQSPVGLADAARELSVGYEPVTADDVKLALAYASGNEIELGNRLVALAHGIAMPRDHWEEDFKTAAGVLGVWRNGRKADAVKQQQQQLRAEAQARAAEAAEQARLEKLETWVVFTCPADTVLYSGGKALKQTGPVRRLRVKLKPGQQFHYDVLASRTVDGKQLDKAISFDLSHGETKEVAIEF